MGQRLNIEIISGGETLANCYYHWSAYTSSALYLTKQIIERYKELYKGKQVGVKEAVELLEYTDGGVNGNERERIQADKRFACIEFKDCTSRNHGLISVTKEGIEDTRAWEEGRVEIYVDCESFMFSVIWEENKDTYAEDYYDDEEFDFESLYDASQYDFSNLSFDDIDWFMDFVDKHPDGVRQGDYVVTWIE